MWRKKSHPALFSYTCKDFRFWYIFSINKKYMIYKVSFLVKNLALHEGQERANAFGKELLKLSDASNIAEAFVSEDDIRNTLPNFISDPCVDCMLLFIMTWSHDYLL